MFLRGCLSFMDVGKVINVDEVKDVYYSVVYYE